MIGILLALVVAFLKSLGELAGKTFTDEKKKDSIDEYLLVFGARFLSLILLFPLVFFISLELPSGNIIYYMLISSALNAVANVTAIKAVKYGDLSLVGPLSSLTIPFLLITSYYITGELANGYGILGVLIIFIGTYFLQIHEAKGDLLGPIKAIYHNKGARYMFITAIVWSISSPFDKLGVIEIGALGWMFYTNILVSLFIALYMILVRKSFPIQQVFKKKNAIKIGAITLLGGIGVFLQLLALKFTLVIYVIAIKRASGIFSVILGHLFYRESRILQKLLAAGIMLAGVGIISIFGNI